MLISNVWVPTTHRQDVWSWFIIVCYGDLHSISSHSLLFSSSLCGSHSSLLLLSFALWGSKDIHKQCFLFDVQNLKQQLSGMVPLCFFFFTMLAFTLKGLWTWHIPVLQQLIPMNTIPGVYSEENISWTHSSHVEYVLSHTAKFEREKNIPQFAFTLHWK